MRLPYTSRLSCRAASKIRSTCSGRSAANSSAVSSTANGCLAMLLAMISSNLPASACRPSSAPRCSSLMKSTPLWLSLYFSLRWGILWCFAAWMSPAIGKFMMSLVGEAHPLSVLHEIPRIAPPDAHLPTDRRDAAGEAGVALFGGFADARLARVNLVVDAVFRRREVWHDDVRTAFQAQLPALGDVQRRQGGRRGNVRPRTLQSREASTV